MNLKAQIQRTHWLSALGGTAGAYLFFFYAGVFLELQKPSPDDVIIMDPSLEKKAA